MLPLPLVPATWTTLSLSKSLCCFISAKNGGRRGVSSDYRRNLQISRETSRRTRNLWQMATVYGIEVLHGGAGSLRTAFRDYPGGVDYTQSRICTGLAQFSAQIDLDRKDWAHTPQLPFYPSIQSPIGSPGDIFGIERQLERVKTLSISASQPIFLKREISMMCRSIRLYSRYVDGISYRVYDI